LVLGRLEGKLGFGRRGSGLAAGGSEFRGIQRFDENVCKINIELNSQVCLYYMTCRIKIQEPF
jgi:hypothetical protein